MEMEEIRSKAVFDNVLLALVFGTRRNSMHFSLLFLLSTVKNPGYNNFFLFFPVFFSVSHSYFQIRKLWYREGKLPKKLRI